MSEPAAASFAPPPSSKRQPTTLILLGMAGSGKTTLLQRLNAYLHQQRTPPYVLNLDPAVHTLPYSANIDIRDTVSYREVMKQYHLGPNGGILTALNLFTTKFDQVLGLVEKRMGEVDHVLVDTPGQIEIFTWSASGAIITDALASAGPTVVAYVVDTPRTTAPATFMSNMLYACSILYKTRLPLLLVFNKTDAHPHHFATEWMRDFEAFQAALAARPATQPYTAGEAGGEGEPSYMNSLMNSMSLVLEEFYKNIRAVGVSAMTGEGMEDFFTALEESRKEYETEYKPELEKLKHEREARETASKQDSLNRLMTDLAVDQAKAKARGGEAGPDPAEDEVEDEDEEDEGEELDAGDMTRLRSQSGAEPFLNLRMARPGEGLGETGEPEVGEDGVRWPRPG